MDELAGLSEMLRKLALDRFRLLQSHLEQGRPLRSVAGEAGIPFRTAQRWVTRYQQIGLTALVRKKRADSGERQAVLAQIKEAIEGLPLQEPPLPISALYRKVQRFSRDVGEKAPFYGIVLNIIRKLPAGLLTLAYVRHVQSTKKELVALSQLKKVEVHSVTIPQWSGGKIDYARLIHSKYLVVDGTSSRVRSENWSEGYFMNRRNVGVIIHGQGATT